jgi:hypothetical protein
MGKKHRNALKTGRPNRLGQPMLDLIRLTDHVEAKQKKSANTS